MSLESLLMKDINFVLTISKGLSLPSAMQLALPVSETGISSLFCYPLCLCQPISLQILLALYDLHFTNNSIVLLKAEKSSVRKLQ